MFTPTSIIMVVIAILVLAYIVVVASAGKGPAATPTDLESSSDLNSSLDQLDSINVDSVDSGMNELGREVQTY